MSSMLGQFSKQKRRLSHGPSPSPFTRFHNSTRKYLSWYWSYHDHSLPTNQALKFYQVTKIINWAYSPNLYQSLIYFYAPYLDLLVVPRSQKKRIEYELKRSVMSQMSLADTITNMNFSVPFYFYSQFHFISTTQNIC